MNWYNESNNTINGYKIVGYNPKTKSAYSLYGGINSPISLKIGETTTYKGQGLFLGNSKEYCLTFFSGLAENELLLTYEFNKNDLLSDKDQDEFRVRKATLISIEEIN